MSSDRVWAGLIDGDITKKYVYGTRFDEARHSVNLPRYGATAVWRAKVTKITESRIAMPRCYAQA